MVQERLGDVPTLYALGYEGHTVDSFVHTLLQAGVEQVADVRESPHSRKPGFSRPELHEVLRAAAIDYLHLSALGSPAKLRERLRYGEGEVDFEAEYTAHLAQQTDALDALGKAAEDRPTAMLCVERRQEDCHRRMIAGWFKQRGWAVIEV